MNRNPGSSLPTYRFSRIQTVEDACPDIRTQMAIGDIIQCANPCNYVFAGDNACGVWIHARKVNYIELLSNDLDKLLSGLSSKFEPLERCVIHKETQVRVRIDKCTFSDDLLSAVTQESGARILSTHNLFGYLVKNIAKSASFKLYNDLRILREYYYENIVGLDLSLAEIAVYEHFIKE